MVSPTRPPRLRLRTAGATGVLCRGAVAWAARAAQAALLVLAIATAVSALIPAGSSGLGAAAAYAQETQKDNRVEVRFDSDPQGFEVQWRSSDDTGAALTLGVTPCKVLVPPGWQVFRFHKPGWPVLKNETAVKPDMENKVFFRRPYGTASVTARPGAAAVQVDGKKVGETPLKVHLPAGVHRLTLKFPGWEDQNETVIIRENQQSTSDVVFPHSEADFIAEIADSEIFLDGESLGKTPVKKIIKAGVRTIKIVPPLAGLPPIFERVTIPNEPKVRFVFRIPNGALRLTGAPNGAEVIDKATRESLGTLPLVLPAMKPGRRTLEVSRRGYWPREVSLVIPDGGEKRAHVELQRSAAVEGGSFFLKTSQGLIEFVYITRGTWVSKEPLDEAMLAELQATQAGGGLPEYYKFGPLTHAEWRIVAPRAVEEVILRPGQGYMAGIMYFSKPTVQVPIPPEGAEAGVQEEAGAPPAAPAPGAAPGATPAPGSGAAANSLPPAPAATNAPGSPGTAVAPTRESMPVVEPPPVATMPVPRTVTTPKGLVFYPGLYLERVLPSGKEREGLDKADAAFGLSADEKKLIYVPSGAAGDSRTSDLPTVRLRIKMSTLK